MLKVPLTDKLKRKHQVVNVNAAEKTTYQFGTYAHSQCLPCCCLRCQHIYRVIQNDCRGTIVQRQFRTKFGKQPPSDNSIRRWYAQFQETGCVCIPELKVRIRTAIETIAADMRNELDYRVDVYRITKGAHIEHLSGK